VPVAAADCFFKPSYKSGLVARVHNGYTQDVTPILLLAGHHLYSCPESVLKVEFPIKNARVKPVI